jgi:hypothetical protein
MEKELHQEKAILEAAFGYQYFVSKTVVYETILNYPVRGRFWSIKKVAVSASRPLVG